MKLYYLTEKDYPTWDKFVDSSPQGSIFSKTLFSTALNANYKILAVINDKNQIEAGIVLTKDEVNNYSSPMLTKYLGILFNDFTNKNKKIVSKQYKITDILLTELKKKKSFNYYFHPEYKNWIPLYWGNLTATRSNLKEEQRIDPYYWKISKESDHWNNSAHSAIGKELVSKLAQLIDTDKITPHTRNIKKLDRSNKYE